MGQDKGNKNKRKQNKTGGLRRGENREYGHGWYRGTKDPALGGQARQDCFCCSALALPATFLIPCSASSCLEDAMLQLQAWTFPLALVWFYKWNHALPASFFSVGSCGLLSYFSLSESAIVSDYLNMLKSYLLIKLRNLFLQSFYGVERWNQVHLYFFLLP